jgi:hypothetical protein
MINNTIVELVNEFKQVRQKETDAYWIRFKQKINDYLKDDYPDDKERSDVLDEYVANFKSKINVLDKHITEYYRNLFVFGCAVIDVEQIEKELAD